MTSKIQQELAKATEINPSTRRDETETSPEYMKRLAVGVAELSDKEWEGLSPEAQKWYNAAADAIESKGKVEIPAFPDLPKASKDEDEDKPTRRRSSKEADSAPAKKSEPEVGDEVKVTTKRGKVYQGKLVEIDEKSNLLVIETDEGEEELNRDRIETVEVVGGAGKAEKEEEPSGDPEVGDSVQIKTKRGKVILCKITEIDGDVLVYETPDGESDEIDQSRIETIDIKAKGSAGKKSSKPEKDDDKPARRGAGKAEKEEEPSGRAGKGANGGVSVTSRMRQLICESPDAKKDEISKLLKKENLEFKDGTLDIAYNDTQKIIGFLRDAGWKAPK